MAFDKALAQRVRETLRHRRGMRGYVFVGPRGLKSRAALKYWVDLCANFAATLPAKKERQP